MLVLVEVVGTHHAPRLAFLHGSLEAGQIDFVEGSVADNHVHLMAIFFVVVEAIVLHATCHATALQALNVWRHHLRRQIRVFAHVLEVAPSERRPVDVHARAQYHAFATIQSLLAQSVSVCSGSLGIPRCCETGEGRESHAGVVGLSCLFPFVPKHIGANAMRSVVGPEVGHAETLHAGTRELALRMDDVNLLGQRHAAERIFHARLDVLRRVEIDRGLSLQKRSESKKEKGYLVLHNII